MFSSLYWSKPNTLTMSTFFSYVLSFKIFETHSFLLNPLPSMVCSSTLHLLPHSKNYNKFDHLFLWWDTDNFKIHLQIHFQACRSHLYRAWAFIQASQNTGITFCILLASSFQNCVSSLQYFLGISLCGLQYYADFLYIQKRRFLCSQLAVNL